MLGAEVVSVAASESIGDSVETEWRRNRIARCGRERAGWYRRTGRGKETGDALG